MMDAIKVVGAFLLALIVVVAIGVAGWQFDWWLAEKNVDRQVRIENRNTGSQTAWRDRINTLLVDIETVGEDQPARQAMIHEACTLSGRLTDNYLTDQIEQFQIDYCT